MIKSGLSLVVATSDGNLSWPLTTEKLLLKLTELCKRVMRESVNYKVPNSMRP